MSELEKAAADLAKVPWSYYMYVTDGASRRLEIRRTRSIRGLSQIETKSLTKDEVAALVWREDER